MTMALVASSIYVGAPRSGAIPSILVAKQILVSQSSVSFQYVGQRDYASSSYSSLIVKEPPSLVIPMGQNAWDEEEYYRSVSLVCHFNGFWPKLVDLNSCISATWIPIMQ